MPVVDGNLAGEQRATAGIAVVEDFQEVVSSLARERSEPPVVEDEEPRPGEPLDELGIRPVPSGEGEFVEQALCGHELEIHNLVTVGGVPLVCYITDAATLVSIPVSWTSLRSVDDFERVSGGRSLWRIDDLVALRGIIDAHLESSATHDQE